MGIADAAGATAACAGAGTGAGAGTSGTMLLAAWSTGVCGGMNSVGATGCAASAAASVSVGALPMPLSMFWRSAMASSRCAEWDSSSCTSLMPSSALAHFSMAMTASTSSSVSAAGSEIACGTVESAGLGWP